jgi:hypothetical protein
MDRQAVEAAKRRGKIIAIAAISEAELACRLVEAAARIRRPPGATAEQALASMDEEDRMRWRSAARAAMEYWRECIDAGQEPS